MEEVIRHPKVYQAYRVGYDSDIGLHCQGARKYREGTKDIQGGYIVPTKRGPIRAYLGDWIVKLGPTTFEVYTLKEFHEQFIFKRAVSQGAFVTRERSRRWDAYRLPGKKPGPKPKKLAKIRKEG